LEKGITVAIPVAALHHDPKYYPEPDRFDPERFNEEERQKRHHYVYLPFGEGPRICIGNLHTYVAIVYSCDIDNTRIVTFHNSLRLGKPIACYFPADNSFFFLGYFLCVFPFRKLHFTVSLFTKLKISPRKC